MVSTLDLQIIIYSVYLVLYYTILYYTTLCYTVLEYIIIYTFYGKYFRFTIERCEKSDRPNKLKEYCANRKSKLLYSIEVKRLVDH